jgi:hypothetical protein
MCEPSRTDQIATSAATNHCRAFGEAPATGQSAEPAPTRPSENVQIVSTQPELPVRCCTSHAPVIRIDNDTAIAASASRYKIVMKSPDKPLNACAFHKYAPVQAGFQHEVPRNIGKSGGINLFLSSACAILPI